jgi:hypothetical protein
MVQVAVLWADADNAKAQTMLWQRKYARSHLGKRSYKDKGVTEADYGAYFASYVWPSWLTHGAARVPSDALRIDCLLPAAEQARVLLATGWFGAEGPKA